MAVLMLPDNPDGWKLEELLDVLVEEITAKSAKIEKDRRWQAMTVYKNNRHIINSLREAAILQRESMLVLSEMAPNQGPTGTPRIGVDSPGYSPVN